MKGKEKGCLQGYPQLLALILPLLLGGCAALQPQSVPKVQDTAESPARTYQQAINLSGRLSVRYEGRSGEEALHGKFEWSQDADRTVVTLFSPLGQAVARIEMSPAGATLVQGGQPARSAENVDALTAETLGWPLPVGGLRAWLQGFAVDASGKRFSANPRMHTVTTQDGWRIAYPAWTEDGSMPLRPRRIDLARWTREAGNVAMRIVIDTWQPR